MEIVKKPTAEQPEPYDEQFQPTVTPPAPTPSQFDDQILMRGPDGKPAVDLGLVDPEGADYLRGLYQFLAWAAFSIKEFARTCPNLFLLNPELEKTLDQIATIGYQSCDTGAQVCRGLWNWNFSRVIVNRQLESFMHPDETKLFDRLFKEWYEKFYRPVQSGEKQFDPEALKSWVQSQPEVADPAGFISLCERRLAQEQLATQSAWNPVEALSTHRPLGERQKTTTDLHYVFRKRPG